MPPRMSIAPLKKPPIAAPTFSYHFSGLCPAPPLLDACVELPESPFAAASAEACEVPPCREPLITSASSASKENDVPTLEMSDPLAVKYQPVFPPRHSSAAALI